MYTINIRGKQNPKDQKMVKLEMIFFKTGYTRIPRVLNITGSLEDWDAKSQSFRVGRAEATAKNKLLFDLRTKYLHMADTRESEERNRSPVQHSHCFDEVKQTQSEGKVKSVLQTISNYVSKKKKRIKNNQIINSSNNAKKYAELRGTNACRRHFFLGLLFQGEFGRFRPLFFAFPVPFFFPQVTAFHKFGEMPFDKLSQRAVVQSETAGNGF